MFEITTVKEIGLGANTDMPIDRLKWTTDGEPDLHDLTSSDQ